MLLCIYLFARNEIHRKYTAPFFSYNQDLTSAKNNNVTLLRDINGERFGVVMQLLPALVIKKYFPRKVQINYPFNKKTFFDAIVRLEQENQENYPYRLL